MTCRHFTKNYTAWREGALPFWHRLLFRIHHTLCPGCPVYAAQMDETVRRLRSLASPEAEPPKEMIDELLSKSRKDR